MVLRSEVIPSELLRSFLMIERTGSYTDAAELLGLSQPAISAHMKRLQQTVGGDLFNRGAGQLRLTAKGETIKHYALRILNLNWQMLRVCGSGERKRIFRIGIQNVFAPTHLVPLQQNLDRRLTEQRALITWGMGGELSEDVRAGYLDAAFVVRNATDADRLEDQRDERLCWVCSPGFVLAEGRPIPLLSWPNSLSDKLAISALSKANESYSVAVIGYDLTTLLAGLRAGLGVCILPQRLVPADAKIAEFYYLPQLPHAISGIRVNEGLPDADAKLLRDAIGEVMHTNGPCDQKVADRVLKAASG